MSGQNKTKQQCKTNFLFQSDLLSPSSSLDGDFVHDDVEAVLRNPDVTSSGDGGGILGSGLSGRGRRRGKRAAST